MNALIVTDIQNDFLPGGALAVSQGDEVIPIANRLQPKFGLVVATQDWHPADHGSFASNHAGKRAGETIHLNGLPQILWPVHCVQGTRGAGFSEALSTSLIQRVFQKGLDAGIDSYSAFFDNARRRDTGLGGYLWREGVEQVYLLGLTTDYCVKFTALDAVSLGFDAYVILDGCRGVNLRPGDVDRAVAEMRQNGVSFVRSTDF
ncbi:MAG TPA: bifunctional nicotinamidase/pyrazinamidase [Terriglobia bacterium]|jgi:nicotinamidase/pyrazinamidase|nr:bifunctional nicotinamidase/pyrazinamidase [Terriglobia bacterium]